MRVTIHVDPNGNEQFIETDPNLYVLVQHPDNKTGLVGVDVMLKHHNQDPVARDVGGWNLPSDIPGEPPGLTRWQRLVRACNHPDAHPQARALGLKE